MNEKELLSIAQQAESEGDLVTAAEAYEMIASLKQQPPVTAASQAGKLGDTALGMAETGLSVASGIPAALGGGLAYLGTGLLTGDEKAAQAVKSGVEDAFTYDPRTEKGKEYMAGLGDVASEYIAEPLEAASESLGETELSRQQAQGASPTGAALGATIDYMVPQVVVEAAGLLTGGGMAKLARNKAAKSKRKGQDIQRQIDEDPTDYEAAAKTLKEAKPEDMAKLVDADPEIINAIDELDLNADAIASYYSKNPQFRAIETGLKSVPASNLAMQDKRFIEQLSKKADDIIETYGGTLDKSGLGDEIKADMLNTVDDIYDQEDALYSSIRKQLPPQTKVNPENTLSFLDSYASEVDGVQNLPPSLKKLYSELKPIEKSKQGPINYATGKRQKIVEEIMPSYGLVNDRRSQIGQQLGRGESVFKNVEQGRLKQLYAAMKRDQNAIVEAQGSEPLTAIQDTANRLTRQRKKLEQDSRDLMGKDLDKGIMEAIGGAVKALGTDKPKLDKFRAVMSKVPESRRQEAVLSAMNEAFKGTAASKQMLGEAQFAKYWEALERSPTVKKELFKHLPERSKRDITNLAKVNRAVYRANQDFISTGKLVEFMDDKGGVVGRMMHKLMPVAVTGAVAKFNPLAAIGVQEILSGSTSSAKAAGDLLASSQFQKLAKQSFEDGVHIGMAPSKRALAIEKALKETKKYQKWADNLEPGVKSQVVKMGLINYLMKPQQEQSENK